MNTEIILVALLVVALWVLWCILLGAVVLFKRSAESGVGHVVLYFVGWIFIAPIMAIWSFFVGLVA